ncbi:lipase family protein [Allorhodopirellula heiligendammensis]|uniref:Lipase (Class 3) n=1 Tax=Allorhodopirellula heiligendammensis TaxID=2714739 RepID=A0A5C6C4E9_9BACT|nr:lipase family protein [Allorhodopirellula heiligendammensis]TWU18204.1 Lipase (class 3) [Allorhodopirellula heiligendammensis]
MIDSEPTSGNAPGASPQQSPIGDLKEPSGVVHDKNEVPVVVYSRARGPIAEMTFLQRSLLFAELAMVSYNDEREAAEAARFVGFPDVTFFEHDGSQAYRFRNDDDCVIACRGTEPNEWNDIRADANAAAVLAETAGKVHRGFKTEVDDLWPMLETALIGNDLPVWFCGHSLGGAMATICAGRCFLSHIQSIPSALFTYGSPRVGDKRYINFVRLDHYRFVNNNDIVTRTPPAWMGYRHCGTEVYIDRDGHIGHLDALQKRHDRWRGFLKGIRRFRIDHFSDHPLHQYLGPILEAARREQVELARGDDAVEAAELTR